MNLPTLFVSAGPMLRGNWHGKPLGSAATCGKLGRSARRPIDQQDWQEIEDASALRRHLHDDGHRLDDGGDGRGLGLTMPARPPFRPSIRPCANGDRFGRRIVEMVWDDLKINDL